MVQIHGLLAEELQRFFEKPQGSCLQGSWIQGMGPCTRTIMSKKASRSQEIQTLLQVGVMFCQQNELIDGVDGLPVLALQDTQV